MSQSTKSLEGRDDTFRLDSPSFWRAQEMLLIQQVSSQIGKGLEPRPLLNEMLHLMSEFLGLNRGRIVLPDETSGGSRIHYSYGLTKEEARRGRYDQGEGITGRAIADEQLIIVQNIDNEPAFLARAVTRDRLPPGAVSFIAMPLRAGQNIVGVLACHRLRHRNRALSDDVAILRILATLAGQLLQLNEAVARKTKALEKHNTLLASALKTSMAQYGIIGTSPPLLNAIGELERVSDSTATVLLSGESGTGKELFARALHLAGKRRDKPFIKVNCGAIPDSLFESELFGHERGAFTGAVDARAGWFEQANTGTIFLDEIGELPAGMQTKLLRTLQEGTVSRLGGKREIKLDVRLVAATNRRLETEVAAGRFREDLFYRLNVIPISLPSLSDRPGDIPLLVTHLINRANQRNQRNVNLTAAAIERLQVLPWPGNIRQLSNVIERIVLLAEKSVLDHHDIEPFLPSTSDIRRAAPLAASPPSEFSPLPVRPYVSSASHSASELNQALAQSGGNKSRAAQALGLTVRQFVYRWHKCGLDG